MVIFQFAMLVYQRVYRCIQISSFRYIYVYIYIIYTIIYYISGSHLYPIQIPSELWDYGSLRTQRLQNKSLPKYDFSCSDSRSMSGSSDLMRTPGFRRFFMVVLMVIPSGKHTKNYGKSPFSSLIFPWKIVIFHNYVSLPEGTVDGCEILHQLIDGLSHYL